MIEIEGFRKSYGDFVAVERLDLQVMPGEILGLVGSNGAGKTTTLRTLAGIIPPSAGALRIAGHDVMEDGISAKRVLGYIPDDASLFDTLTVWEHLAFTASAYRIEAFESRANDLLRFFELDDKRDAPAHGLSRGMRQKVAIACAYLHEPKGLLFDEPLTGLDPQGIRAIQQSMRDRAANGAAIIISSHLLSLVQGLCSHILVLDHGRSLWYGPVDEALQLVDGAPGATSLEDVFFQLTGR